MSSSIPRSAFPDRLLDLAPVVDIGPAIKSGSDAREEVARAIDAACASSGFLVITGHGVSPDLIEEMYGVTGRFFDLPLDRKLACVPSKGIFRGYTPVASNSLAASLDVATPPDLCEFFCSNRFDDPDDAVAAGLRPGREGFFAPNIWPEDVPEMAEVWGRYYAAMVDLATTLMRLFATALGLDAGWFDDKIDQHITNLVVNAYPPQTTAPLPGQLRRGAHTDFGSLTILYQDDAPGGLQVQTADGGWWDVPAIEGTFVVNLGDLMAAWTNDRWVSTMHRVVNPPPEGADTRRFSIPFFHQPNFDAVIECIPTCLAAGESPRHPPVTSGQWLIDKLSKSY